MSYTNPILKYSPREFAGSVFDKHYLAPNVDWVHYNKEAFNLLVGAAEALFDADPRAYLNRDLDDRTPYPIRYNFDGKQELTHFGTRWKAALVGEYSRPQFVLPEGSKFGEYALKQSVVVSEHTDEGESKALFWTLGHLRAVRYKMRKPEIIKSRRLARERMVAYAADTAFKALAMHEDSQWCEALVPH